VIGGLIAGGISLVRKLATSKAVKKVAKKAITAVAGGGGSLGVGAVGGMAIEKYIPKLNLPDFGKVGKGIFGSSRGRIAAGDMGACPRGYHLNKHRLTDGTEPRTVCVRNRSINFANGRAARRAGRRLRGTVKMLKKSFSFVSARPPKGKFIVRKK
jgi:hypothetical protein